MRRLFRAVIRAVNLPEVSAALKLLALIFVLVYAWINKEIDQHLKQIGAIHVATTDCRDLLLEIREKLHNKFSGGRKITVGVNSRDLQENMVTVFAGNAHNLRTGDVIHLKNFHDDSFQPILRFVVVKEVVRGSAKSQADLFISADAAKRLGLGDYKKQGVFDVMLLGPSNGKPNL